MREQIRNAGLFYVALPAVVGFLLGANQAGFGRYLPWWASIIFWVSCTLLSWLIFHSGTLIASLVLKPWEPPLIAKLAVGLLLASLPARALINAYAGGFETLMQGEQSVRVLPEASLSWSFAAQYAKIWSGPYVLWISANLFFDRIVGYSRYRPKPRWTTPPAPDGMSSPPPPSQDSPEPDTHPESAVPAAADQAGRGVALPSGDVQAVSLLLSRLPRSLGYDITALKSEDHYLRVYTERGDALILYKLGVAIEELQALGYDGHQVHRSYWVRRDAIETTRIDGRNVTLRLKGGLFVPVSYTYRESARRAGLIAVEGIEQPLRPGIS